MEMRWLTYMVSQTKITVRYAETDQMGIAHHANYPIWFEASRTDFIKHLGYTYSEIEQMGVMLPLAELTCRYLRPSHYEDELTVETRLIRLTPGRMVFGYRVFKEGEDGPLCTGTTTHALAGRDLRPINLKKNYPALYEILQDAVTPEE